ncbi:hypothetical protein F350042L8_15070 [Fusobacterium ulcerans]|uniref:cyclophilin-like fold protein n=1 Tax=Fusobacterium ulcerans TaxID=861 RepID=UPI0034ACBFF6
MSMKILLMGIMVFFSITVFGETGAERIKFSFEEKEIVVLLRDNSAAKSLLEQLPLTLKFENYGGIEKISYPPEKLDISKAPNNYTPSAGDLTYYAPWGNLAFFHKDYRNSDGLVPLGRIESGIENLQEINGDFSVTVERIK